MTLLNYSLFHGAAQELAAACSARPGCQGFTYYPHGRDNFRQPLGILKGNPGQPDAALPRAAMNWNPGALLFVREGVPIDSGSAALASSPLFAPPEALASAGGGAAPSYGILVGSQARVQPLPRTGGAWGMCGAWHAAGGAFCAILLSALGSCRRLHSG